MTNKIKNIYEMNENEIYDFMITRLPIKKQEKDKYAEVFTNPILINKMLDLFPKHFWTNHKLTWLDPSAGAGFFMICVYIRLMNGLQKWEPNDKKRSNHIIENMLYMVEINRKNYNICKSIFGTKVNLICDDFLTELSFKNISFDCIVGNPPFQDDYGLSESGKRINGGKSKLYERIFLKAFEMLKQGGYLSFVVPDNIFSGNGVKSYQILIENQIPFVSFNPSNQSFFDKVQQQVCYFLLHKNATNANSTTTIEHDDKLTFKIKLQDRPVNPIRNWTPYTEKLINTFVSNERNNVRYIRGKSLDSYKGSKYPIIFTSSKTLHTNKLELAIGYGIKKAIIFSISPELEFIMDYSGKFGNGPNTFYIPFATINEGKKLETFLKSDEYKTLALATKTTRQYLKIAFIEHLKLTKIMRNNTKTKTQTKTKTKKKKQGNNKTRKR